MENFLGSALIGNISRDSQERNLGCIWWCSRKEKKGLKEKMVTKDFLSVNVCGVSSEIEKKTFSTILGVLRKVD